MKNDVEVHPAQPNRPKDSVGFYNDNVYGPMLIAATGNPRYPYVRVSLKNLDAALWSGWVAPHAYNNPLPPGTKITITVGEG